MIDNSPSFTFCLSMKLDKIVNTDEISLSFTAWINWVNKFDFENKNHKLYLSSSSWESKNVKYLIVMIVECLFSYNFRLWLFILGKKIHIEFQYPKIHLLTVRVLWEKRALPDGSSLFTLKIPFCMQCILLENHLLPPLWVFLLSNFCHLTS